MVVKGARALEVWSRRVTEGYPHVRISNMTTSWKDGMAFCAILHRFRPDLLDYNSLDPAQIESNCTLVFGLAESELDIPALLDPADMAECSRPDRLSILTYLAEFYHKFKNEEDKRSPDKPVIPVQVEDEDKIVVELSRKDSCDSGVSISPISSGCNTPPPSLPSSLPPTPGHNLPSTTAMDANIPSFHSHTDSANLSDLGDPQADLADESLLAELSSSMFPNIESQSIPAHSTPTVSSSPSDKDSLVNKFSINDTPDFSPKRREGLFLENILRNRIKTDEKLKKNIYVAGSNPQLADELSQPSLAAEPFVSRTNIFHVSDRDNVMSIDVQNSSGPAAGDKLFDSLQSRRLSLDQYKPPARQSSFLKIRSFLSDDLSSVGLPVSSPPEQTRDFTPFLNNIGSKTYFQGEEQSTSSLNSPLHDNKLSIFQRTDDKPDGNVMEADEIHIRLQTENQPIIEDDISKSFQPKLTSKEEDILTDNLHSQTQVTSQQNNIENPEKFGDNPEPKMCSDHQDDSLANLSPKVPKHISTYSLGSITPQEQKVINCSQEPNVPDVPEISKDSQGPNVFCIVSKDSIGSYLSIENNESNVSKDDEKTIKSGMAPHVSRVPSFQSIRGSAPKVSRVPSFQAIRDKFQNLTTNEEGSSKSN